MPRVAERMTEKRLRSLTKGCSCGVVPGLEVRVRTLGDGSTAKYFLLRERATGKAYQIGQYPKVSLSEAFKTAAEWREKIKAGIDPVAERKALRMSLQAEGPAPAVLTVREMVYGWIRFNEERGRWKNARKPKERVWDGYCNNHFSPDFLSMPAKDVTAELLYDELGEKWRTMIDTPERILSDMRNAYDWAMRQEMIPVMMNPARVAGGKLGDMLSLARPEGGHEPALPPKRMPAFFAELMKLVPRSQSARCLAFAILTSARNSAAREATWDEIQQDDEGQWFHVIPRERMKMKSDKIPFDRKTPLCAPAKSLLDTAPRFPGEGRNFIFPNINQ